MKNMNFTRSIDKYDPESGFYFKSISQEKESSRFSKNNEIVTTNIGVLDPLTNKITTIFPTNSNLNIGEFIFETSYCDKSSTIQFNNNSSYIRNNNHIQKRDLNNHVLISTITEEIHTLWVADKKGTNVKEITKFSDKSDWHLDVKNMSIRVVSSEEGALVIDSFDW